MAKNCTCSLLLETIDKIFIDDSCCCLSTVVTPTDNCCSCEPVIDLIDTDKFACASFDNNRNLKYQMVKESWLVYGTNSKTVYNAIIEAQAANIMLLLKVLGGNINENTKNYVVSPIEITQDIESELYIIKYFKFIEDKLHICIYTIHKVDDNNYETSWDSELLDAFDADLYYTKTESDNKYVTKQYLENNYYNISSIDTIISNFYNKTQIDEFFNKKVLWEKGEGRDSTQRKSVNCLAGGVFSFATGGYNVITGAYGDNPTNGTGSSIMGVGNTINGMYTFTAGHENTVNGNNSIVTGLSNRVSSDANIIEGSFVTGVNNEVNASYSGALGHTNVVNGSYSFAGGQNNTIESNHSFSYGLNNTITGTQSAVFGSNNNTSGNHSFISGAENTITKENSSALGTRNNINGHDSIALGSDNIVTKGTACAIGNSNYAKGTNSIAMNEASRAIGMSSIAGGRRSYTGRTGACAIGSPINIQYFAKLVEPNASTTHLYYGYLVLTDAEGNPINIPVDSILDRRFRFLVEDKYSGELTIALTSEELENSEYINKFTEGAVWPGIEDIQNVIQDENRYIYFKPNVSGKTISNIIWLFKQPSEYGNGVREISYASGYDGCKAVGLGSHAEGCGTIAEGEGSHSEGINTLATNSGEHACGRYNYSGNGTLFSVGVGKELNVNTSNNTDAGGAKVEIIRKNALEITSDGNIYLRVKNNDDTETVYDLGKLLNALITSTGINTSGLTDTRLNSLDTENSDILPATTKEM